MLRWVFQLAVLAVVVAVVVVLFTNVGSNSERLNIPTGYGFLDNPAQFTIPGTDFRQTQPVRDALVIGLGNTIRLSRCRHRRSPRSSAPSSASPGCPATSSCAAAGFYVETSATSRCC